jgi:hypothetical protein
VLYSKEIGAAQTASKRLCECRITERKLVGKGIYVFDGSVYVFCHTLDNAAAVFAIGLFAVLAEFALAAAPVGIDCNSVARLEFGNTLADGVNDARDLVSERNRIGYLSCILFALDLVVVTAANAAIRDLNTNLARFKLCEREIADCYVFGTVKYNCFHFDSPLLKCRADNGAVL